MATFLNPFLPLPYHPAPQTYGCGQCQMHSAASHKPDQWHGGNTQTSLHKSPHLPVSLPEYNQIAPASCFPDTHPAEIYGLPLLSNKSGRMHLRFLPSTTDQPVSSSPCWQLPFVCCWQAMKKNLSNLHIVPTQNPDSKMFPEYHGKRILHLQRWKANTWGGLVRRLYHQTTPYRYPLPLFLPLLHIHPAIRSLITE